MKKFHHKRDKLPLESYVFMLTLLLNWHISCCTSQTMDLCNVSNKQVPDTIHSFDVDQFGTLCLVLPFFPLSFIAIFYLEVAQTCLE